MLHVYSSFGSPRILPDLVLASLGQASDKQRLIFERSDILLFGRITGGKLLWLLILNATYIW